MDLIKFIQITTNIDFRLEIVLTNQFKAIQSNWNWNQFISEFSISFYFYFCWFSFVFVFFVFFFVWFWLCFDRERFNQ